MVSASQDWTLRLWSAETGEELHTLEGHADQVVGCAFSPDGVRVVSASWDQTLRLWEAETGQEVRRFVGHTTKVHACAFSPDGTRVVSVSGSTLKLWDTKTGRELHTLVGHKGWVEACAFSPDGFRVASSGSDRTLKIWDSQTGGCLATLPLSGNAATVAHHPHRASVVCGDGGGSVHFVDLVGVPMGPLVVTARDLGNGPVIRCPVCLRQRPLQEAWLGQELDCPESACHVRLRVNPFVVRRAGL